MGQRRPARWRSVATVAGVLVLTGCGAYEELSRIPSPSGEEVAIHVRENREGALGDFTHRVDVEHSDVRETAWYGYRTDPIYLMWRDDDTLEVYVLAEEERYFERIRQSSWVVTRVMKGTSKADAASAMPLEEWKRRGE